jgi:hypothetical protein
VTTIKTAHRGHGVIVRLHRASSEGGTVGLQCPSVAIKAAWLCDARERDIIELDLVGQTVQVPLDRSTVTVRLLA